MTDIALVRALEERLMNAWPALQTIHVDGWLLRMALGHTKRANAASPLHPSTIEPGELIAIVRDLYKRAGIPPMVRITPLASPGVDDALAAAGWEVFDRTTVMAAPLVDKVKGQGLDSAAVVLSEEPSPAWIEGAAEAYEFEDWQRDVLGLIVANIRVRTAFATVYVDRDPVGYGLAVAERGHVGLYDLAVSPDARGKGVGTRMVTSLMHWGRSHGAGTAYLQVRDTNAGARALYARLGFVDVYHYHCRRLRPAAG